MCLSLMVNDETATPVNQVVEMPSYIHMLTDTHLLLLVLVRFLSLCKAIPVL